MGAWHTRGLRGSVLEECINFTNDYYRQKGIAVIQKIPTPITPVEMNKENSTITLAYFDKQSTVDYIGARLREYRYALTPRRPRRKGCLCRISTSIR